MSIRKIIIRLAIALLIAVALLFPIVSGCDNQGGTTPDHTIDSGDANGGNANDGNDNGDEESETFTVTFISNGGTEILSQTVKKGGKAVKPADPTKPEHRFKGWYDGETEWDFNGMTVNKDTTLVAKWESGFTPPYLPED